MIKFILPFIIILIIVLFWEKINNFIQEKYNIKINNIVLTLIIIILVIIFTLLYF